MLGSRSTGKTSRLKVFGLNLLAIRGLLQKHINISLHTFPLIDLVEIIIYLDGTWTNGIPGTMSLCNNIKSHIISIWHTQSTMVFKCTIPTRENEYIKLTQ